MKKRILLLSTLGILAALLIAGPAGAHHDDPEDDGAVEEHSMLDGARRDPSSALSIHDSSTDWIISSGPFANVVKNLEDSSKGDRDDPGATTDVWALGDYAYTGTFNNPCGGDPEAGIWVWDVHNKNKVSFVGVIPSPAGSRSNDVKVASMNSGDILVHSNESCAGGPGGFEIYNVDDPTSPQHLAHVQTDDVNAFLRDVFGFTDFGVHNLFLFTQGDRDYVSAVVESEFGNFQVFDITDPTDPTLVGFWGAEELRMAELGLDPSTVPDLGGAEFGLILELDAYLFSGFGASQNRFLHDITITADGTQAYLSNWDAGLVLLDISDPTSPSLVSVALDLSADGDMEVNSHAAWMSEDGSIVVETNEDFAPFGSVFTIDTGPGAGEYPSSEGAFTTPIVSLPGSEMSGPTTYVGLACTGGDPVPPATGSGQIALIQRGVCRFDDKATNAINAGYSGMVVFNDAARGDALVTMGGDPRSIPGVFVGHSTGLLIAGVASAADLVIGAPGEDVTAAVVPNGWGQVRIWDYSDPANPVLASSFDTVCSATVIDPSCDPAGTYSVHNVIVESLGNKVKAYISWYDDGMLVLDISDPYNPVETARYTEPGEDYWGVYKETNSPWFYGSDRNGGLTVFKEFGSGSQGKR